MRFLGSHTMAPGCAMAARACKASRSPWCLQNHFAVPLQNPRPFYCRAECPMRHVSYSTDKHKGLLAHQNMANPHPTFYPHPPSPVCSLAIATGCTVSAYTTRHEYPILIGISQVECWQTIMINIIDDSISLELG